MTTKRSKKQKVKDPLMAMSVGVLRKRLRAISELIEHVELRSMAVDGPVTNTRDEMTDYEMRLIYGLAKGK